MKNKKLSLNFRMPPEIILKKTYTSKCDIWSLGITGIEMAEKSPPDFKFPYNIAPSLKSRFEWSDQFHDFIESALQIKEDDRPTAQKLLNVVIKSTCIK
jgi:serine/threonine protein kinase